MKTFYSVAIGNSTLMNYQPAPDFTCGHKHKSPQASENCRKNLLGYDKKTKTCSAKWYNAFLIGYWPEGNRRKVGAEEPAGANFHE